MKVRKPSSKFCSGCKLWLPITEFGKSESAKITGIKSKCKKCDEK